MRAEESLRRGDLAAALSEVQDAVRNSPADPKLRVFLCQLLGVLGQWDRMLTQLHVLAEMDASTLPMVSVCRPAIQCEALRAEVFAGRRSPLLFGEPRPWMAMLIQALAAAGQGRHDEAASLREGAFEAAPATSGRIDGQPFEWLADADGRLGPVLEAIVNGQYYWIPIDRIACIQIEPPQDLRDIIWAPARFTWSNGGETVGQIPVRYPGTEAIDDGALGLARKTEWVEAPGLHTGRGQRMFATETGEFPLLQTRQIEFDVMEPSDAEQSATTGTVGGASGG